MGLPETPTGSASDIEPQFHEPFEQAIKDAATEVGEWTLGNGNMAGAWTYYRLLGQPQPIKDALSKIHLEQLTEDQYEVVETSIRLAFHEGLDPVRGYGWILSRYGLCNAITTLSSPETPGGPEARKACLELLVNALHNELGQRLAAEIERLEGNRPIAADVKSPLEPGTIAKMLKGREVLFEEEAYHIDLSHLSSVVQLGHELCPGEAMARVRDLCAYGQKLKGRFVPTGEPPLTRSLKGKIGFLRRLWGMIPRPRWPGSRTLPNGNWRRTTPIPRRYCESFWIALKCPPNPLFGQVAHYPPRPLRAFAGPQRISNRCFRPPKPKAILFIW